MSKIILFILVCSAIACNVSEPQRSSEPTVDESFSALLKFSESIPADVVHFSEIRSLDEREVKEWLTSKNLDASKYYILIEDLQVSIKQYIEQEAIDPKSENAINEIFHESLIKEEMTENDEENGPLSCYFPYVEELKIAALEIYVNYDENTDSAAKNHIMSYIAASINYNACLKAIY